MVVTACNINRVPVDNINMYGIYAILEVLPEMKAESRGKTKKDWLQLKVSDIMSLRTAGPGVPRLNII